MKNGLIRTPVSCSESYKAVPTFRHLIREARCGGLAICSGTKIAIAFTCSSATGTRKLKRSVDRELKLLRHHGLASLKRRRR